MPLPSLYRSGEGLHAWSVVRAAGCGAVIGAMAALFKILAPVALSGASHELKIDLLVDIGEIAGAALFFAALCAGAALLRNFLARSL